MQSQGSTSSQPSFDSLSSSDSLLQSDSEQAEDDEGIFLAGRSPAIIIGGGSGDRGVYADKEEEDGSSEGSRPDAAAGDAPRPKSQGDLLFANKCAELQGFINPLLELLSGLKRGRFERGLTGFQQSVAMDRIQRIVGVLQRPGCGEKYLSTLLQVEMMLKMWFPQITASSNPAASTAPPTASLPHSTPPHKHRDQSHIPVKKRRLSWTDAESPSPSPAAVKRPHVADNDQVERSAHREVSLPALPPSDPTPQEADGDTEQQPKGSDSDSEEKGQRGQSPGASLTWAHVVPISSPSKSCLPHESPAVAGAVACKMTSELSAVVSPSASRGSTAMQDSSVTSTTPPKLHTTEEQMPTRPDAP
ncbi:hypothetical protein CRUP_003320 [Coryphaenoides rupestris]|nr:hypothetical protein CRUP_003320 [Coryphaenoides rupestris]